MQNGVSFMGLGQYQTKTTDVPLELIVPLLGIYPEDTAPQIKTTYAQLFTEASCKNKTGNVLHVLL